MDKNTLAHTTWNCKYHIVFAPKYRRQCSGPDEIATSSSAIITNLGSREKAIAISFAALILESANNPGKEQYERNT